MATTAAILAGSGAASTHAAVIASYQMTGTPGTAPSPSSDVDPNSTASNLALGPGTFAGQSGVYNTPSTGFTNYNAQLPVYILNTGSGVSNSLAEAVAKDVFFQFSITPSAGFEVDISSLSGLVTRSATSSVRGWELRSSADNYATTLAADTSVTFQRSDGLEVMTPDIGSLDLSTIAGLQNLTSIVRFRIYANTGTGGAQNTGRSVDFDDVIVNGTVSQVAVPEPTSLALTAASVAMLRRRRSV